MTSGRDDDDPDRCIEYSRLGGAEDGHGWRVRFDRSEERRNCEVTRVLCALLRKRKQIEVGEGKEEAITADAST